jgi:hypothetical protein
MITLGPSLTGLRGTQVTGSIIYTFVTLGLRTFTTIKRKGIVDTCNYVMRYNHFSHSDAVEYWSI